MKSRPIAFAAIALFSVTALASQRLPAPPRSMSQVVADLEARYRGDVVGIRYEEATGVAPHYHVDVQYPGPTLLALNVDAATLEVVGTRGFDPQTVPPALADVAAFAATQMSGEVMSVALDAGPKGPRHYDVDVRVADGRVARLTIDAATREIGWRSPPVGFR